MELFVDVDATGFVVLDKAPVVLNAEALRDPDALDPTGYPAVVLRICPQEVGGTLGEEVGGGFEPANVFGDYQKDSSPEGGFTDTESRMPDYNQASESEHGPGNDPERVDWFRGLGLGLFVHWTIDSQLGSVISHSMAGASEEYVERYIEELPKAFDPSRFDPHEWARLAKVAGVQYVVFTTKHHNGFAMWDTDTTEFNVTNTPYGDDIVREVVDAFRAQNIAIGFYFSPDDFWLLHQQGKDISRDRDEVLPRNNPELMEHNEEQIRELFTEYGQVDTLFIDGDPTGIRELAWELQPEVVITRGSMETPEQELRAEPSDEPWESCMTMGTQWNYKPANEEYKSPMELIENFVETRAKGGNLLLNVGPRPDGTIPREQEDRLRTLGLWNFVNREAIFENTTAPKIREGEVWFTKAADEDPTTVYAIVTGTHWPKDPDPRTIAFESVRATEGTEVGILGQSGRVFEYEPELEPTATWTQDGERLYVTLTHAQRIYNADSGRLYDDEPDYVKWPYPVVIELSNARVQLE